MLVNFLTTVRPCTCPSFRDLFLCFLLFLALYSSMVFPFKTKVYSNLFISLMSIQDDLLSL